MYTVKFNALQCDTKMNRYMKAADLPEVGIRVVLTYRTDTKPTGEYLANMALYIESMPPQDGLYFKHVVPQRNKQPPPAGSGDGGKENGL